MYAISRGTLGRWALLAFHYAGAQAVIRGLSTFSALLLVNFLPVAEYGLYTLLLANLTFLVGVSDFGATGSLAYFWRRCQARARSFAAYVTSVQRLRQGLFLVSATASVVYVLLLSRLKGYDLAQLVAGTAMTVITTWYFIYVGTGLAVLRLQGQYNRSYAVEAAGEFTKLLFTIVLWWSGIAIGWFALAATAAGAIASRAVLLRSGWQLPECASVPRRKSMDGAVRSQVLPTIPWTLFFVLQSPLLAWLAASYGSTQNLAELGALSRLSSIVGLLSGFSLAVLVPRLSRIADESLYLRYYGLWWLVLGGTGVVILLALWYWPDAVLWILGKQYTALHDELLVAAGTSVIMTLEFYAGAINRARGWMGSQPTRIAIIVVGQAAAALALDFSQTFDLLLFGMCTALLMLIVQLAFNVFGFLAVHRDGTPLVERADADGKR